MKKGFQRKKLFLILMGLTFFLLVLPLVESFFLLPFQLRLLQGETQSYSFGLPLSISIQGDKSGVIELNNGFLTKSILLQPKTKWQVRPLKVGQVNLQVKILGIIPCKEIKVEVLSPVKVVPAGSSVGVLLQTKGAIVIGFSSIIDSKGRLHYPGREVGIAIGDLITKVNGKTIHSTKDIIDSISSTGSQNSYLNLEIQRGDNIFIKRLKPIFCPETKKYRIGLYVLDNTEGVGTLTFYNPENNKYGALGHLVTETNTNTKMRVGRGQIVDVSICAIQKGKKGNPGEKVGTFSIGKDKVIGDIEKNTNLGIFGKLKESPPPCYYSYAIPVALVNQVETGPAEMLTVLNGRKIEKFQVVIEKVVQQKRPSDKGLIVRVVDQRLLRLTGGIIQGMSGSPVIQKGKLIGAVTHVFVNDPTRGYGVLAEWMVKQAS